MSHANSSEAYELVSLKRVTTINDEALSENTDAEYIIQYIDIGNVTSSGEVKEIVEYRFEDAPSRARRLVKHGDVIISTVRTYLQAIAPIENPPPNLVVSTGFAVVRPITSKLTPSYCKYALREPAFINEVTKRSVGVSYPAINTSELGRIPISLPPINQQLIIAEFLDTETAKIDALVEEFENFQEVIYEKRSALIENSILHGVDEMQNNVNVNVDWIKSIPEHWSLEFVRWLMTEVDERSNSGEEELLTVSHITGVTPRSEKNVNMFEADSLEGYKVCQPGDLVINTLWAWMGAMGVAFQEGIVSPAYHVYRQQGDYDPRYIDYLVRLPNFAKEVTRYSKGVWSSRLRLYPDEFFKIVLPVPPLEEQRQIIQYLDAETAKLDELSQAIQDTIKLLQERRAALISAAVTGKIRVTE